MSGFESVQIIEKKKKYTAGFLKEWGNDEDVRAKANKMADFYIKAFSELNLDIPENEVVLIHFTDNESLKLITKEKKIKNYLKTACTRIQKAMSKCLKLLKML